MSIKEQGKNWHKNHKIMYGKPFFGLFRARNRYYHRHLTDPLHWAINLNLYGTEFVYAETNRRETWVNTGGKL